MSLSTPEQRDAVAARDPIGQAVETPVPFSMLGRLKAIADALAGGGSGGGGAAADRELIVTIYQVKTAFAGASVGDTITATRVIDVSGATATQIGATVWRNETTALSLGAAPAAANLNLTGAPGLTDAQLRAAAIAITAAALPLPAGAATDAKVEAVRALLAGTLAVSGPLTDAQLRAAAVAITVAALPLPAGAATDAKVEAVRALLAGTLAVSGPLTDTQMRANPVPVSSFAPAAAYTDRSIAALTANQAAGTDPALAVNAARRAISITPAADCTLTIASGAIRGWPLFAGVPNTFTGPACPLGNLYISGLVTGAAVTIMEA